MGGIWSVVWVGGWVGGNSSAEQAASSFTAHFQTICHRTFDNCVSAWTLDPGPAPTAKEKGREGRACLQRWADCIFVFLEFSVILRGACNSRQAAARSTGSALPFSLVEPGRNQQPE